MRAKLLLALAWTAALPGYRYSFPKDHFAHPEYKTEWWYFTGNLRARDGHRFGFELTFFRSANNIEAESTAVWRTSEIWLAHLALSDVSGHKFFHTARLNRSGPGLAGVSEEQGRYWNGNWQVKWDSLRAAQTLQAVTERFALQLRLRSEKPPVINGRDGVSQKGPTPGEASHYVSLTRLNTDGTILLNGDRFDVTGISWMDHEFFTEQNDTKLAGWDWFAIQLNNRQELMLYRLRLKGGGVSPFSSGTFVDANGTTQWLSASDFALVPSSSWHSDASGATYPTNWHISVPKFGVELNETTPLADQELRSQSGLTPTYWEGAVDYAGKPTDGVGYLEMTGYGRQDRPVF